MTKYKAFYTNVKSFEAENAEEAAAKAQSLVEAGEVLSDEAAIEIVEDVESIDELAPTTNEEAGQTELAA